MHTLKLNFSFFILYSFLFIGCNPNAEKRIDLHPAYDTFVNVISVAKCTGPERAYTTEVHSTKDGYTYFRQDYDVPEDTFEAIIIIGEEGYSLQNNQVKDTLSKASIEIIRGHEFHKIQMFPDQYFTDLTYEGEELFQDQICEKFKGVDLLSNQVNIFYNRKEKLLEGFTMLNPGDTTERIEIIYKEWIDSPMGKIAKNVEIIQGGKDVYTFEFKDVEFNVEDFKKKQI